MTTGWAGKKKCWSLVGGAGGGVVRLNRYQKVTVAQEDSGSIEKMRKDVVLAREGGERELEMDAERRSDRGGAKCCERKKNAALI